jgi:hypothetical protein
VAGNGRSSGKLWWLATAAPGKTRSRSEHGRSEVVALVREAVRVTAVHPASCGGGNGRGGINRGRSEVVVREVLRVTGVHLASCGVGYGRVW